MTKDELFSFENDEFRVEFLLDLANFCEKYINECCNKVVKKIDNILSNDLILNLLHELRIREEQEREEFFDKLAWRTGDYISNPDCDMSYDLNNNALLHSKSYRDVLYDLLIKN